MKVLAIIPVRYDSNRLPGKPLVKIGDKSMVHHVYKNVMKCEEITDIIVATDNVRIHSHLRANLMDSVITFEEHRNGTNRCAEAYMRYCKTIQYDFVLNVQGDNPFINPDSLTTLIEDFRLNQSPINTLVYPISYVDDKFQRITDKKHIGVYGFRPEVLLEISQLPVTDTDLEQNNWINAGYPIKLVEANSDNITVDTNEDLKNAQIYYSLGQR